jgi:xanthine dehydrogenase accessory factor
VEPLRPEDVVHIFGAGHISTFVAPLAKMVGFRVVVIDDRQEFANRDRFPHADDILLLPFSEAWNAISLTRSSYLVIVTRGHAHDTTVLRGAVREDVAYVGMIGSRRKRNVVYRALMGEGVPPELLDRVHSPIGLDIGAETPEEIAVSIVGELISVRAERARTEKA